MPRFSHLLLSLLLVGNLAIYSHGSNAQDANAQEPKVEKDTNNNTQTEPNEQNNKDTATRKPTASSDRFDPTEEISEDLSVSFPVDI